MYKDEVQIDDLTGKTTYTAHADNLLSLLMVIADDNPHFAVRVAENMHDISDGSNPVVVSIIDKG